MKIAVIGSRDLCPEESQLAQYLLEAEEIVSGGARGVDTCAESYARKNKIKLTVILPEYERYGRAAPIYRNRKIVDYADKVVAFWNGSSRGTLSVIRYAEKINKELDVIIMDKAR